MAGLIERLQKSPGFTYTGFGKSVGVSYKTVLRWRKNTLPTLANADAIERVHGVRVIARDHRREVAASEAELRARMETAERAIRGFREELDALQQALAQGMPFGPSTRAPAPR